MNAPPLSRREMIAGTAATAATLASPPALAAAGPDVPVMLDALAWRLLALEPERATSLGVDTGQYAGLRARSEDKSPAGVAAKRRFLDSALAALARVPTRGLDPATATNVAVAKSAFGNARDGFAQPYGDVAIGSWRNSPYTVIQNVGAWADMPRFLDAEHPVKTRTDAEAYLSRLGGFARQLDGETVRIRAARAKGLVPPDFLLAKAMTALGKLVADAAAANGGGLVTSLTRRTADIPGDWQRRAAAIVKQAVAPALARQLAELTAQARVATSDAGMLRRPHGAEWYAWGLRASTTTRRSPAEIHAIGVQQLAELQARMETILRGLGLTRGTIPERIASLDKDPRYAFPTGDEGRRAIVAYMESRIALIRKEMPRAFRRVVEAKLEIRRLPLAEEPGAPRAYGGAGSIDGSIPGRVWVNLGDTTLHSKVTVPDLMFHEGIPGHVWQGEYARKMPLIRTMLAFNAYSEGWALYAEQLADELGAYDGDPVGRLGYLQGFAWRAVRLVIDTGLHAMGWTRERAMQEFLAGTGLARSVAESEVDRYCSWPGQACGYKMGQNEIVALRTRAQSALGAKFDLRDFNQAVVDGGNVPLDVLAANVDRYVLAGRG